TPATATWNGTGWQGQVVGRNGIETFLLTCDPSKGKNDPAKWSLTWSGCDTGFRAVANQVVVFPFTVSFQNIRFAGCCAGWQGVSTTAGVQFKAPCANRKLARRIDQVQGVINGVNYGSAKDVYAFAECCISGCVPCTGCCKPLQTTLHATVSGGC